MNIIFECPCCDKKMNIKIYDGGMCEVTAIFDEDEHTESYTLMSEQEIAKELADKFGIELG